MKHHIALAGFLRRGLTPGLLVGAMLAAALMFSARTPSPGAPGCEAPSGSVYANGNGDLSTCSGAPDQQVGVKIKSYTPQNTPNTVSFWAAQGPHGLITHVALAKTGTGFAFVVPPQLCPQDPPQGWPRAFNLVVDNSKLTDAHSNSFSRWIIGKFQVTCSQAAGQGGGGATGSSGTTGSAAHTGTSAGNPNGAGAAHLTGCTGNNLPGAVLSPCTAVPGTMASVIVENGDLKPTYVVFDHSGQYRSVRLGTPKSDANGRAVYAFQLPSDSPYSGLCGASKSWNVTLNAGEFERGTNLGTLGTFNAKCGGTVATTNGSSGNSGGSAGSTQPAPSGGGTPTPIAPSTPAPNVRCIAGVRWTTPCAAGPGAWVRVVRSGTGETVDMYYLDPGPYSGLPRGDRVLQYQYSGGDQYNTYWVVQIPADICSIGPKLWYFALQGGQPQGFQTVCNGYGPNLN